MPESRSNRVSFRLSDSDLADIDALGAAWSGPVTTPNRTEVIREAVRRCLASDRPAAPSAPPRKKSEKTSRQRLD